MSWPIELTETAEALLARIKDRRIQEQLIKRIARLANEPDKQGKPLSGDLFGYYSVRAVSERYRILFSLAQDIVTVHIVAVSIRKEGDRNDIYALALRLFRQGLLDSDGTDEEHEE